MAGQVKHAKIFSSIVPDWRLLKLLTALKGRTRRLFIGAVARYWPMKVSSLAIPPGY